MNAIFQKKYALLSILCIMNFFWALSTVRAQQSKQVGKIRGFVQDSAGIALSGVNVFIENLDKGSFTDSNGRYVIKNIPTGTRTIVFSFVGYQKQKQKVRIRDGQTTTVDITLREAAFELNQMVVTGSAYATDPLKTPADIESISGANKFQAAKASLGSTLASIAGVSVISTGPSMGKSVIHGLSGSRIRVLDNGTPMNFRQFGVRHGPNVDPFIADRIEVVKGAASVQYGSDALGGAVNIISRNIPDAINETPFLRGTALSSFDTNNNEYSGGLHLDGAAGRLGFTGTFVRRTAGDIRAPDVPTFKESDDPTAPKFAGKLNNTDFDQFNGEAGLGYAFNAGEVTARFKHWSNNENLLLPNGKGLGQNLANNSLQFNGDFHLGHDFVLKPTFTYNNNLRQSNAGGAAAEPRAQIPSRGNAHLDLLIDSYTSRIELQHPDLGPFRGTIGAEYLHEDQHSRGIAALVPSGSIDNFGSYIFEQAELSRFTVSAGARIDTRKQDAKPSEKLNLPDHDAGETNAVLHQNYFAFSGSVGASYSLTDHFVIAANAGRGFRAPSMFNLHAHGVHGGIAAFQQGNPYLKPEYSLNTELSLRWQSGRVRAKVSGYRNYIKNYILLINTGNFTDNGDGPPILRNAQGSARLLGADASFRAQAQPWLQFHGTFELVKGKNVDKSLNDVDELPLLPASTIKGGFKLIKARMGVLENGFIGLDIKHAFAKDAAGRYEPFWQFGNAPKFSQFGVASTDAYTLLNASLRFDVSLWNRPIAFNITAENLFNTDYRDFLDTYKGYALSPGRGFSFKVKVPFGTH